MRELDVVVVIVTYRSARLAIESLSSLQTERSTPGLCIRAIVVDNASGDFEQIERAIEANGWASWATIVLAPMNGGFAYGNNLGIQRAYTHAAPDYIYLLNPDAHVRSHSISALVTFLEVHPDVGIAGSSFENLDGSDWPIAFRFPTLLSELIQGLNLGVIARLLRRWDVPQRMSKNCQPIDWVSGASMMIRHAVFASIGGLDETYFLYFEETDFCRRALKAGFATWYVPESRVMHIGEQSTNMTGPPDSPRRLPSYWFESRRRYFAVSFGLGNATAIDVVAVIAHAMGWLKRALQGRRHTAIPYFVRDLIRHSVLWQRNRHVGPVRTFLPWK